MQNIITLSALCSVSDNGFSLDELVFKINELFEIKGLSGFASLILRLTDEEICLSPQRGNTNEAQSNGLGI